MKTLASNIIHHPFFRSMSPEHLGLVSQRAEETTFKAGEVILSGSQSPLVPVAAGDNFHCSVGGLGSCSVRFV